MQVHVDIVKRRKERRRERNKLSAQAYRMRRREQSVKTQKVLSTLEEENTRLKNKVKDLENEINSIRQSVSGSSGQRLQASPQPALLKSSPPPPIPSTRPSKSGQSPFSQIANGNAVGGGLLKSSMFPSSVGQQKQQQQPVDNDQLQPRHQAPVDNFLFTQHATQVTMATPFGFPTGAAPTLTAAPTITTTTSITMATPPRHHPHTLHSDLNANASVITNGSAMGGGACQNDNMNNNNNGNNLLLVLPVGQGPARHQSFNNLTNAL
nr:hypothetical protein BaRGS_035140 [Batillaria attramentaria]